MSPSLTYVRPEKISLKAHPSFNEAWLHDRIKEDPIILGLGDVRVRDHERRHSGAGRLDLLLDTEDDNRRYEVEVMLGETDPDHIIRTIEYWDIERRRYPSYEHVAVLVAEDITSRFLNVLSLMSGSIPFIAIQLSALQVGENIVLNFVRVVDQTDLRKDDSVEDIGGGQTDRAYWEKQVGAQIMAICDDVLSMVNSHVKIKREFNFLEGYIGLRANGVVNNFVWLEPHKKFVHVGFRNPNAVKLKPPFEEVGLRTKLDGPRYLTVAYTSDALKLHRELLDNAISQNVEEAGA